MTREYRAIHNRRSGRELCISTRKFSPPWDPSLHQCES
jgi:hypothetical protein